MSKKWARAHAAASDDAGGGGAGAGEILARRARRTTPQSPEDEALAACGALLGSVEALAFELPESPGPRTERALADARRYGARVRDQLEALSWLALPELRSSTQRTPFALARWIEHACRGALPRVQALEGSLRWPSADELQGLSAALAVSRMDRALTVMIEQLVAAAGHGASLTLTVGATADLLTLELSARAASAAEDAQDGEPVSALLVRAWGALLEFHGGAFALDPARLTLRCTIPRLP